MSEYTIISASRDDTTTFATHLLDLAYAVNGHQPYYADKYDAIRLHGHPRCHAGFTSALGFIGQFSRYYYEYDTVIEALVDLKQRCGYDRGDAQSALQRLRDRVAHETARMEKVFALIRDARPTHGQFLDDGDLIARRLVLRGERYGTRAEWKLGKHGELGHVEMGVGRDVTYTRDYLSVTPRGGEARDAHVRPYNAWISAGRHCDPDCERHQTPRNRTLDGTREFAALVTRVTELCERCEAIMEGK